MKKVFAWMVRIACFAVIGLAIFTVVRSFLHRNDDHSREALLDTIWAYEYRSDIRTVDVHIRRLREKLEENPAEPKYILTKWGVGYYFRK